MDPEHPEHPPQSPPAQAPAPSDETASEGRTVRIEVCEKHGLRYNAATDEGCARCRTEAGARTVGRRDFSTRRTPDVQRGLLVAATLVAVVGGGLFLAHTVAYRAGATIVDGLMEEASEAELEDDTMTEEEAEAAFERLFGEGSDDDE